MDNKQFYHSFFFKQFRFTKAKHTDSATGHGAANHYIGRLLHGSGKIVLASQVVMLQKGDFFYIPMGCRYHSYWYPDDSGTVQWTSFGFTCFPSEHRYLLQVITPSEKGIECWLQICKQLDNSPENISLLYSFLADVIGEMVPDTAPADRVVQKAVSAMRADPHARLDQIAQRCGISQTALYNAFKNVLGTTPNDMRQRILCEKAQELLSTTSLSVEDISSAVGFSSSSYFRKILYRHTGKTPLQIRKENSL